MKITRLTVIAVTVVTIAADQVAKVIARKSLVPGEHVELVGQFLTATRIENEGAFLGLGESLPPTVRKMLFIGLPFVALIVAMIYLLRSSKLNGLGRLGLALLIGGGLGNLFDRLVYGSVTDFFYMDFGFFHTGIFNVGDMAIMVGVGMLLVSSYVKPKKPEDPRPPSPETA
jgi:signal peptidase II